MRLVILFGPPAVGKMTVGREMARRSSYRLLHDHALIEPLLEVFDHGTPAFTELRRLFLFRVLEEAAAARTDLVTTHVLGLELAEDAALLAQIADVYEQEGGPVRLVELYADLETRLARNRSEPRLAEKRSKRDLDWSDADVRALERHTLSTGPSRALHPNAAALLAGHPHLRLDNTDLSPDQAADRVLDWLSEV